MLTDAVKEAVRIETVRTIDAWFIRFAEEYGEPDRSCDDIVEEMWSLFEAGELLLVTDTVEPVDGAEERERAAKENRPIVEARRAVLAAGQQP